MSGELRTGQFRYTVTPDDDFVIGSPLNAGLSTTKYLVFQVSHTTGFGANPHIRCDYSAIDINPATGLPGCWRIKFSNDGSNVSDFVLTHLENTFTAKNTFAGPVIITGTASFSNSVVFSSNVVIPLNRLMLTGLVSNRVLVSSAGGTQNVAYALTTTTEINQLSGITGNVQSLLNLKANIDSPALTGTPIAPTPAVGTNNTRIATTEFVQLAAASAGVRGYDNRSLILNDAALPGTYYRLSIYNGLLSITPYLIPGADYILFKDVVTGTNYKVSITNGVLHRDVTLLPGMFSYTLLDFPLSSFHRVYIKNGNLNNTPE